MRSTSPALIGLMLVPCLVPIIAFAQTTAPAGRGFRMGFTGFPHDFTLEAVNEARAFAREHGDIIAHHIEGVPWAEVLADQPFSAELTRDWEGKKQGKAANGKVYLAISPGRGDLKEGEKSAPFPKELKGKSYDDPHVKKVYLAYCLRMIEFFKPDYLAIGIEVNEIQSAGAAKWKAYAALHRYVYQELKKTHPDLPIFASFTLHNILNASGSKREAMVAACEEIMPQCDLVAISFYPFLHGGTTDIDGCLKRLTDRFDKFNKPYAFVETGEAAERLQFPTTRQVISGTAAKQEAFYESLLGFAQKHDTRFVISFVSRDYDALWEKIKNTSPEVFMAWRDCGLVDEAGKPRPALAVWDRYFHMPLRRR